MNYAPFNPRRFRPYQLAERLKLCRTSASLLLSKLVEIGYARRIEKPVSRFRWYCLTEQTGHVKENEG